jgi:hypothetical protein
VKNFLTRCVPVSLVEVAKVMVLAAQGRRRDDAPPYEHNKRHRHRHRHRPDHDRRATNDALNFACTYRQETLDQVRRSHGRDFETNVAGFELVTNARHLPEAIDVGTPIMLCPPGAFRGGVGRPFPSAQFAQGW